MEPIIKIQNVSKDFNGTPILNHIDLEINRGEIVGLLGSNGSGKTTLLKLMTGLLEPTEGKITIHSCDPWSEREQVLKKLGVMIESPIFYEHLTAYENIEIHLEYMNKQANISDILNAVELVGIDNKPVSKFSMGMKQRLGIARALSHEPEILLLDEPINGLDPVAIKTIRELFLKQKEQGTTILLSSHILSEMLQTVESIVIISDKKIEYLGKISELKMKYEDQLEDYLIERMRQNNV